MANPPILGKPLILYVSATESSLGALLAQLDEQGKERAIYYISRTLVSYEVNYTSIEKACLAVVFSSQKLRHYMLAHTIHLIAKIDPLKYLLGKAALTGRLAKWMMILSEFDIDYIECKAIKGQAIADQLANFPIQDNMPIQVNFPDEHLMYMTERSWKLFFDGSCMQNGSRAGVLFVSPHGYTIHKSYKLLFPCTNNIVEYEALTNGLKMAIEWNITELHIYGDSQLIINQVNEQYQTKDDKLVPYKKMVDSLRRYFTFVTFQQIPRAENKAADAMATLASLL